MIHYTYGSNVADQLVAWRDETTDYIYGRRGNDNISELSTLAPVAISDDFFFGGAGNDMLSSFSGADVLRGGEGDDKVILYGIDVREAHGGAGWDVLYIKPIYANGPSPDGGMNPNHDAGHSRLDHDPIGHNYDGFEKVVFLESWEAA